MTSQRRERIRAMIDLARPELAVLPEHLDADPWKFNVQNGTIDLRTGSLHQHRREDLITRFAPALYDPDAECPRWLQFLNEIFAGHPGLIQFLQRFTGHCLTGDVREQILVILYGSGANGKSVFTDTILGVLGEYGSKAPHGFLTATTHEQHPTELARLCGQRLVVTSETEEGRRLRIQLVKELTGDATITGRFMRQDFFEFERTHKTVLVTNNKPVISEPSNAAWRRIRLVPFQVTIPPERQDPDLLVKLRAEASGILAWAVRGCLDWQRDGLGVPDEVRNATAAYRSESDHVGQFLEECIVDWRKRPEQRMRTSKSRMFSTYSAWCRDCGEDPKSTTVFSENLRARGFEDKSAWLNGKTCKCWIDITLQSGTP